MTWVKRGLNIVLLVLSTEEGKWSHPVAQFFKLSVILLISSVVHGDRKILAVHLFFIKEVGSIWEVGIFLSNTGPILVKKLWKRFAIREGSSVALPLIVNVVTFWGLVFLLLITSFIICNDFLRFCWLSRSCF